MAHWMRINLVVLLLFQAGAFVARADQISLLIEALGDKNNRQGASIALARQGEAAVPGLRTALASGTPDVRIWSAYTLGQIGPKAVSAVDDLKQAIADSDPALRAAAAQSLGKIGSPDSGDVLAQALEDDEFSVRRQAVIALGKIEPVSEATIVSLIAVLSDPELRPIVRKTLIQIGPATADLLVESLADDSVRFDVVIVLQEVDPKRAKRAEVDQPTSRDFKSLQKALFDESRPSTDHKAAAESLAKLGDEGNAVLVDAFEHRQVARIAAAVFSQTGSGAVPALRDVLSHERPEVRSAAADALGSIGPDASAAVPDLIRLLNDEDRDVRYHAVRTLHELGEASGPAVAALSERILDAREQEPTRQWALKTLVVTLPETKDAVVKTLIEASGEEANYGVRQLARQLVLKLDPDAAKAAGIK